MACDINGHCGDPKELREKENKAGLRILETTKEKRTPKISTDKL